MCDFLVKRRTIFRSTEVHHSPLYTHLFSSPASHHSVSFLSPLSPVSSPLLHLPLYMHNRPDYANMSSFMSSVPRIFYSPRVCKEACYHHRPIVEYSLPSSANPSPVSSIPSQTWSPLFLTTAQSQHIMLHDCPIRAKLQGRRRD